MRGSKKSRFIPLYDVILKAVDAGLTADQLTAAIRQYTEANQDAGDFSTQRAFTRRAGHRHSTRPSNPQLYEAWADDGLTGPAALIRSFVLAALSEFKPELDNLDDKANLAAFEAVTFATDLALRLAGVPESWLDEYRGLTAHLVK